MCRGIEGVGGKIIKKRVEQKYQKRENKKRPEQIKPIFFFVAKFQSAQSADEMIRFCWTLLLDRMRSRWAARRSASEAAALLLLSLD